MRRSIKDIAAKAGVSIGTVDRVLHNRGRVAPETEVRVREALRALEYHTNVFASTLRTGKVFRFGVLMPRTGPFAAYWELPLKGILRAAGELKPLNVRVETFFYDVSGGEDAFRKAIAALDPERMDGLIMAPVLGEACRELIGRLPPGMPLVFFDTFLPGVRPLTTIGQDSRQAGRVAARLMRLLLPEGGPVVVVRHLPTDCHLQERENGFMEGLEGDDRFAVVVETMDLTGPGPSLDARVRAMGARHPLLRGIFVTNANTFPYIPLAQNLGTAPRPVLVGFDLIAPNVAGLRSGAIDFLISQKPEQYGYLSVNSLYRHLLLRESVPEQQATAIEIVCRENLTFSGS